MLKKINAIAMASALLLPTAAIAQSYESDQAAPGYSAIMQADYATAEREIRGAAVSENDPARNINLGIVLAKQGHRDLAAQHFQRVLQAESVTVTVFNGQSMDSHQVAKMALASLASGVLSH